MIEVSRLRRVLLLGLLLAGGACESHACTLIGCFEGLTIRLDGKFEPTKTYQVDISTITANSEMVHVMSCSLTRPANREADVRCSSAHQHSEFGASIVIRGEEIKNVVVSISENSVPLGRQMLDAHYTTREINGPGCGTCTSATVAVTIP